MDSTPAKDSFLNSSRFIKSLFLTEFESVRVSEEMQGPEMELY